MFNGSQTVRQPTNFQSVSQKLYSLSISREDDKLPQDFEADHDSIRLFRVSP
jgi:hypothetical protein